MRFFASLFSTIASMLLIVALFISSVQFFVMDRNYFGEQYRLMETSKTVKIPYSSLMDVTDTILDYLANKNDDMNVKAKVNGKNVAVFTERELSHMRDVKALYQGALQLRNIALIAGLAFALLAALMMRGELLLVFARGYRTAFIIVFAIIAAISVWIAIDFSSFWTSFHLLFFRNDLWQLDASKSVMINMYPLEFWAGLCKNIALSFAGVAGGVFVLSMIYLGIKSHRRRSLLRIGEQKA